ncbi:MAG: PEP-CTERM sorting domain-containing protein [Planctomycetota bacterium]
MTQTFAGINIAGLSDLEFSVLLAEDDDGTSQDWDLPNPSSPTDLGDFVLFEYQIDGGGYTELFTVAATTATSGNGFSNGEPEVNGVAVTSEFTAFTSAIAGTGSTLDIRLTWNLNAGDEDLAIDNLEVNVIPEPTSLALLGLGGLLVARRRRG